jgi:voltage-gated potassium channel
VGGGTEVASGTSFGMTTEMPRRDTLRRRLHTIIFEADTPAGRGFDTILMLLIASSVGVVVLDSVAELHERYDRLFLAMEWGFTAIFTVEYLLRLYCVERPGKYAFSFFGLVDLLAIVPTYASVLIPGAQGLLVIRVLRLLRIFRVLKLASYVDESRQLWTALQASRRKIQVFLFTVITIVLVVGALMHVVEGPANGFTSIPMGIYWAVVTLTTVGFGDLTPQTPLGRFFATVVMLLGYGIIAVPTGIVTAEMTRAVGRHPISTQACPSCAAEGHEYDARFCRRCGATL